MNYTNQSNANYNSGYNGNYNSNYNPNYNPNYNYNNNYNNNYNQSYNMNYGMNYGNAGFYQQPNFYQRSTSFFAGNGFLVALIIYTVAVVAHLVLNFYCLFTGDGIFATSTHRFTVGWDTMLYYGNTIPYLVAELLLIIFLFVAVGAARRNTLSWNHVRNISGTVLFHVILVITYAVFFVGLGIYVTVAYLQTTSFSPRVPTMHSALSVIFGAFLSVFLGAIIFACVIMAILLIVFALCGFNGIRKFARSAYLSLQSGNEMIKKRVATSGWLITFGIFSIILSLGGITNLFYNNLANFMRFPVFMVRGVAYIMFGVLVSKSFKGCITGR